MANRRNSIKKIKSDEKKRVINKRVISEIRTFSRKFDEACAAKEVDTAKTLGRTLFSKLDKAIKRGTIKENTVNRTKSRANKRLNLIQA